MPTTPHRKTGIVTKHKQVPHTYTDLLVRPTQWKRNMRFGTWNVRSLYMPFPLITAARELARYQLDLVGVQEVRWDKVGTVRAGVIYF